jgi:hypothetical protein
VGPQPCGCEPVVRSRVARRAARLAVVCVRKSRSASSRTVLFRRTGATGAALAQGGHNRGGPVPNPRPAPRQGLLSMQLARPHHRTVPAPTLRRLASAPLVRIRLGNDIAKVRRIVKNKNRTNIHYPLQRERMALAFSEGRERGRHRSSASPLPAHIRSPRFPAEGGGTRDLNGEKVVVYAANEQLIDEPSFEEQP